VAGAGRDPVPPTNGTGSMGNVLSLARWLSTGLTGLVGILALVVDGDDMLEAVEPVGIIIVGSCWAVRFGG
jgi:hypothetical protein